MDTIIWQQNWNPSRSTGVQSEGTVSQENWLPQGFAEARSLEGFKKVLDIYISNKNSQV